MQEQISRAILCRLVLGVVGLVFATACGTQGCQGCSPQPIPGGFPQEHRFDNAMQVRLTHTGFDFIENNFSSLMGMVLPSGLNFDIPPSCGDSPNVCCGGAVCKASLNIQSINITPTPPNKVNMNMRAIVSTNQLKVEVSIPIIGWVGCNVKYDSDRGGNPTLGIVADVDFVVDPNDSNKTHLVRTNTSLQDFGCEDIEISGGIHCDIANWACGMFEGMLQQQIGRTLDSAIDGMLKQLPMGQEGRFEASSFLASYSPRTTGEMDYFLWGGGYTEIEAGGMSMGVMGGFRAAQRHVCVPDCEGENAPCKPPTKPSIPRSPVFSEDQRPDGKPFDVGIGIDTEAMGMAAYAFWRSGALCLDISTQAVSKLSTDLFSLIVPSIKTLTGGSSVPMMISVRPRQPATMTLGAGTYHKDKDGSIVVDDPLITITSKDFAIDIYIQLDERMVRLFTIVGNLNVPVLLFADAQGRLQPQLGELDKAYTDIRLENAQLITEDTENLAKLFPTVLNLAAGFLSSGFDPIELPSMQNLKLILEEGSITTTEDKRLLAIFAKLGIVQTSGYGNRIEPRVETEAVIEELRVPPTASFRLGPDFVTAKGPVLTLKLGARFPSQGEAEYTYRVDGGFYSPWVEGDRLVIRNPLFWLQGEHLVEVMARLKGKPLTSDPTPARVSVIIDTVPPQVRLVPVSGGVRAEISDVATPQDKLELSWSIDGSPFSEFSARREVAVPAGTRVEVRVRDRGGNATAASTVVGDVAEKVFDGEIGGCGFVGREAAGRGAMLGLLLVLLVSLSARGRRRRR